jgi:hypothetical protein
MRKMTASVSSDWSDERQTRRDGRLFLVDVDRPESQVSPVVWDWSLVAVIALVIAVLASIVLI